jgi:hypothetical protein
VGRQKNIGGIDERWGWGSTEESSNVVVGSHRLLGYGDWKWKSSESTMRRDGE